MVGSWSGRVVVGERETPMPQDFLCICFWRFDQGLSHLLNLFNWFRVGQMKSLELIVGLPVDSQLEPPSVKKQLGAEHTFPDVFSWPAEQRHTDVEFICKANVELSQNA